jgi:hypothetical protein
MDRTVDPSTPTHRATGGVHHGVDVLLGDVALHDRQLHDPILARVTSP